MAKSKNHTNHNQVKKAHANGIKGARRERYLTQTLIHQVLKRNIRRSRLFDPSIKKSSNLQKKINTRIENKKRIQEAIKVNIMNKALGIVAPSKKTKGKPVVAAKKETKKKGKK